jgi:hypothetical protein
MTVFQHMIRLILVVSTFPLVSAFQALKGVTVKPVKTTGGGDAIDIGEWLAAPSSQKSATSDSKSLLVFGTYAADFNAIEYVQRLRYYWPILKEKKNFSRCALILNCQADAALALCKYVDLPVDDDQIELWEDNTGAAGRKFGVGTGWLPDNKDVNPFLKLFGMLWGLGAWATLPAVIGGYIGNPFVGQPWIEDALAVGQRQGRWPGNALEITNDNVIVNKFDELPLVGKWPRRPLELATLRLQSMMGISLKHWSELAPDEQALEAGVLTQFGGCLITSDQTGEVLYEYRDPGICAVANFETILKKV